MSWDGIPSVMATQTLMPASAASIAESAANSGGTNNIVADAPVLLTASFTVLKTGNPKWDWPPLPGVTPPTKLEPYLSFPRREKIQSYP